MEKVGQRAHALCMLAETSPESRTASITGFASMQGGASQCQGGRWPNDSCFGISKAILIQIELELSQNDGADERDRMELTGAELARDQAILSWPEEASSEGTNRPCLLANCSCQGNQGFPF